MYIQLVLCQLFVGRKNSHGKGDSGDTDPSLDMEPSEKSGVLSPTYSSLFSCPRTELFVCPCISLPVVAPTASISPCLVTEQPHTPRDDRDSVPQYSSTVSCPGLTAAAHPTAGGQSGSSINEDFNDGYRLVLQASESHLNSGNFKLFWQYKRA